MRRLHLAPQALRLRANAPTRGAGILPKQLRGDGRRVSRRHLIKLETAKASPTLEMMERIAAGLGVELRDMVDFAAIAQRMTEDDGQQKDTVTAAEDH